MLARALNLNPDRNAVTELFGAIGSPARTTEFIRMLRAIEENNKIRALVRRKARIHPGTLLCLAGRFVVLGIAAIVHAYQGKQSENGGKADSYRARQIHFHYEGSKGRNVRPHNSHIGGHKRIC